MTITSMRHNNEQLGVRRRRRRREQAMSACEEKVEAKRGDTKWDKTEERRRKRPWERKGTRYVWWYGQTMCFYVFFILVYEGERLYWVGGRVGAGTSGKPLKGSRDNRAPFTRQQRQLSHASSLPPFLPILLTFFKAPSTFAMKAWQVNTPPPPSSTHSGSKKTRVKPEHKPVWPVPSTN